MRLPFATDRLFGGPGSTRPVCVTVGHPGGASPVGPACRAVRAFIHPDAPGLTRASQGPPVRSLVCGGSGVRPLGFVACYSF